jgi:hypothetical protein
MERAQRANSETGTGFACSAKLSEIRSSRRYAPVVRMTNGGSRCSHGERRFALGEGWAYVVGVGGLIGDAPLGAGEVWEGRVAWRVGAVNRDFAAAWNWNRHRVRTGRIVGRGHREIGRRLIAGGIVAVRGVGKRDGAFLCARDSGRE